MAPAAALPTSSITCFSKALGTSLLSSDKLLLIRSRRRFSMICRKQTNTREDVSMRAGDSKEKERGSFGSLRRQHARTFKLLGEGNTHASPSLSGQNLRRCRWGHGTQRRTQVSARREATALRKVGDSRAPQALRSL